MALALALLVTASLVGGCGTDDGSRVKMPASSSELEGEDHQDVMTKLQDAGFTNVETEAIEDLITGWLTKDGEVEEVSVDGTTVFSASDRFPKDAQIVVRYHTFPNTESDQATDDDSTPAPGAAVQEVDDTVLTPENSEQLAAVLNAENPGDPQVKAFVDEHVGRTIEFDGYTWDWANHSSYSSLTGEETVYETLYDTNIYVGDVENAATSSVGPIFRVEGFSMPNFSPALNRMNVHVAARVSGYDQEHEFFQVTLISIEAR